MSNFFHSSTYLINHPDTYQLSSKSASTRICNINIKYAFDLPEVILAMCWRCVHQTRTARYGHVITMQERPRLGGIHRVHVLTA